MKVQSVITTALFISSLSVTQTAAREYSTVIDQTASMVSNSAAQSLARKQKLQILNLTWEDTGRFKNSSVGPNISDMTIQVEHSTQNGKQTTCMPVVRFPNFSDKTGDISADKFFLQVGNEKGDELHKVSLKKFLSNMRNYLSNANSWAGNNQSLWNKRDEKVLVSAQACFLPIPQSGDATFNPVLFNYQSVQGDPAVLTILATREGTSVTVIDNKRDGFQSRGVWGQRLFFNQDGERASFTGKRMSDFVESSEGKQVMQNGSAQEKAGLNMVMLIQVPLKQRTPHRNKGYECDMMMEAASMGAETKMMKRSSNVENAVIGHGSVEGPFTEIDYLPIERDTRFPIRVTVQFYKATDNGVVSEADMSEIASQI